MKILHILSSFGLMVLVILGGLQPWLERDPEDRLTAFGVFAGLLWAFVLFTGFFQIGSVNTVAQGVLYKLGATALGGGISLVGFFTRANEVIPTPVFYVLQACALVLFGFSLFWALSL